MTEPRHRELRSAANAVDRESRTEALLVDGLDQYFQGHFDEAIHLWTRVLFIDRAHARARAYINRARTAQGERLRRGDELLHAAGDLLTRGELDQARHILANAEHTSGADEKVAELWARLERVERTRRPSAAPSPAAVVDARPVRSWRPMLRAAVQAIAAAAFGALLVTAVASPVVGEWIAGREQGTAAPATTGGRPLVVLGSEDVALVRARRLYARGRLAEALAVLERVEAGGSSRAAVDQLRVEIQGWLLSVPGDPASAVVVPEMAAP
jgi:hypothetical protein